MIFKSNRRKEVQELFAASEDVSDQIYSLEQIKDLPAPVQSYFNYSLKENQPYISYVRFKHSGQFRPTGKWTSIRGKEYFTTQNPGFLWYGKVPFVSAKDSYVNGKGNLQIKLFSFIKIVNAKGKEYDQGELLRWLSEGLCAPTILLPSKQLRWEAIDDQSAKVIFTNNNLTVEGIFFINEQGQITMFKAKRYRDTTLEDWTGYCKDYRIVDNVKIPFYMVVEWNLESGNHCYAKFSIDEIEFNKPFSY